MFIRIVTALIGIPFLLYVIIHGSWLLHIALLITALIGVYEFYHVFSIQYRPIKMIGYVSTILFVLSSLNNAQYVEVIVGILLISALITMVLTYPRYTITDVCITVFGAVYITFLLSFIVLVRNMPLGQFFVWFIFISAWGTDTFAYFTGYFFGKNKLAPVLSPKKTIEGAIGGIIGAALIAFVYTWGYGTYYNMDVMQYLFVMPLISSCASIISQLGDLSASAMKRSLQAKDFGHILPGHGGMLDRFDSVLFAAPFIYIVLQLLY